MKKKVSHFYREPLNTIKQYSQNELDARWDCEDDFQHEAIRFIYSTVHPDEMIEVVAIAGGSARLSLRAAGKLKMMGIRAGITDLMLLWRGGNVAFIELKAGSYPSLAQKEFLAYLDRTGHRGTVCRTLREIERFILSLGLARRV